MTHVLLAAALLAAAVPAPAALLTRFKLDDGILDPSVTTIFSEDGIHTGTFAGATPPAWDIDIPALAPPLLAQFETIAAITNRAPGGAIVTSFPGTNSTGDSVLGTNARTIALWLRTAVVPTATASGYLLTYGSIAQTTGGRFSVRLDNTAGNTLGKLRLEISGGSVTGTNTYLCDDQWHHVAVVCPAGARMSNVVLYVDGNVQQTTTGTPGVLINTVLNGNPVHLGNYTPLNANATFLGAIDDVRIYNEALDAARIAELIYGTGNAPGITQQPLPQQVHLGRTNVTATFSVGVSGSPSRFQWKKDGQDLPNATNQSLVISPVTAADLARYHVAITNSLGGTSSAPATLTWSTPDVDPLEQTVLIGGAASFGITMTAQSTGYTYQWLKGGVPLAGQVASSLSLPSATLADATNYSVWVSLAGQSATSAPVTLRVLPVPASAYAAQVIRDGPAAYWRLDDLNGGTVATDLTGFHHGALSNFVGSELEQPGALAVEAGTASSFGTGNWIEVPYSSALQHTTAFSLEAWVNVTAGSGRRSLICSRNQFFSSGYELAVNGASFQFRTGASTTPASQIWNDLNGGTVSPGIWQHVVATFDGTRKRLYVNGALVGTQATNVLATPVPLRLGAGETYNPFPGEFFSGLLDEVAVYWKALTPEQVARHYQQAPPEIRLSRQGGSLVLSWDGNWVLQQTSLLEGMGIFWDDVANATSPYGIPEPLDPQQFYRLRSP